MRRIVCMIAVSVLGCDGDLRIVLAPPWKDDATVVITMLRDGRPIGDPALVAPGEKFEVSLVGDGARELVAVAFSPSATAPDGSALAACGVAFADSWTYPEPEEWWSTGPIDDDRAEEISFARHLAEEARPFGLRNLACNDVPDRCGEVVVETIAAGLDPVVRVAAISDREAVFVRQGVEGVELIEVDDLAVTRVATDPPLVMYVDAEAYHGSVVYLVGGDGTVDGTDVSTLAAIGLDGTPRPVPPLEIMDGDPELSIGSDGFALVGGNDGTMHFTAGSTIAATTDPPIDTVVTLAAVSAERAIVIDSNRSIFFGGAAGFVEEYQQPLGSFFDVKSSGGDANQLVVGGTLSTLLKRNEDSGDWVTFESSPSARTLDQVVVFEGGIALIDNQKDLEVLHANVWCRLPGPYISIAASAHTIYLVGPELRRIRM